mmetsp:Transcript_60872/g.177933  ORF Transcript_60872/g.177933 Transcript_60872/m.177933 type:complete len:245 (+) Transcript_60872:186-920(+)
MLQLHLADQLQRPAPLWACLASTDCRGVRDSIGDQTVAANLVHNRERQAPLLALVANTHGRATRDHVHLKSAAVCLPYHMQAFLPSPSVVECVQRSTIRNHGGAKGPPFHLSQQHMQSQRPLLRLRAARDDGAASEGVWPQARGLQGVKELHGHPPLRRLACADGDVVVDRVGLEALRSQGLQHQRHRSRLTCTSQRAQPPGDSAGPKVSHLLPLGDCGLRSCLWTESRVQHGDSVGPCQSHCL